jgi:pescadillo protein
MILPVSNYAPGKKLPPHLSPYYEVNEKGEYVYEIDNEEEIKVDDKGNKEENKNEGLTKEDKELREMMLSNNKKKLLQKIRDEALKKKKTKVKVSKATNVNVSNKEKIRKDSKNKNKDDKDKE